MSVIEFEAFGKIPRLRRDVVITEKIDGTNAAVIIKPINPETEWNPAIEQGLTVCKPTGAADYYAVGAQSRKRLITPDDDNFGFARWVRRNANQLINDLGPGRHFGEWWGSGIQRGYGLVNGDKRFSLFNVKRFGEQTFETPALSVVPVLHRGPISLSAVQLWLDILFEDGSNAAPGFMNPEGVIVYHTAGNLLFKATIHGDDKPKGEN